MYTLSRSIGVLHNSQEHPSKWEFCKWLVVTIQMRSSYDSNG